MRCAEIGPCSTDKVASQVNSEYRASHGADQPPPPHLIWGRVSALGIFFLPVPVFAPPHQTICPQQGRGDVATPDLVPFYWYLPLVSAISDIITWSRVLLSHTPEAARSY